MAERSKALDSSSSLFGGVGSNPTPSTEILFLEDQKPLPIGKSRRAVRAIGLVV